MAISGAIFRFPVTRPPTRWNTNPRSSNGTSVVAPTVWSNTANARALLAGDSFDHSPSDDLPTSAPLGSRAFVARRASRSSVLVPLFEVPPPSRYTVS